MRVDALWARALIAVVAWFVSAFAFAGLVAAFVPDSWATVSFLAALAYGSATYLVAFFWVDR
jgi:hypothetical protein